MTRSAAITEAITLLEAAEIAPADARLEAFLLLRHATGITREEFYLRPEMTLSPDAAIGFGEAIARRARREPLAYITGERGFYGLTFTVTPSVLIPRPETEGVVEAVLAALVGAADKTVLDVGTGSGVIAIAVAVHAPAAHLYATDLSQDALAIAEENATRHGVSDRITFLHGDLLAPLPEMLSFTVIVSNPPYIAPQEIEMLEPEVRDYEPRLALGIHEDPLHFYRRLAIEVPERLVTGGALLVEVGQGQSESVAELFRDAGLKAVTVLSDLGGIGRVVIGRHLPEISSASG